MTTKSGEWPLIADFHTIADIRAKLDLVQKKNCRLKVAEDSTGKKCLIAINSQGYAVDDSGNKAGVATRHVRSNLIEVFQYITAELNQAKEAAQTFGTSPDLVEHLKAVQYGARVMYTRSDEKLNSWFSLRHLFARIFASKQLSDYKQQVLDNIYPLLYQIDGWNLSRELKNQQDTYEIRQQISDLTVYLEMSPEVFAACKETFREKLEELYGKILSYQREFPEESKKELQAWNTVFSKTVQGSGLQSNRNALQKGILDLVLNNEQGMDEAIDGARSANRDFRRYLQTFLWNVIQASPSEPSDGEKQLLLKRLYDYHARFGKEETNQLIQKSNMELKESHLEEFFNGYTIVLRQNRTHAENLYKIQALHRQVQGRIGATASTFGKDQHETLIKIEKNLSRLEQSMKCFDWNCGKQIPMEGQFSAENMKALLNDLNDLKIGDLPEIRRQFSPLIGLMMEQVSDPEKVLYLTIAGFSLDRVPQEITRFSRLKSLTLSNNNLKTIEEGLLEHFPNLDVLNLKGNQLSELPSLQANTKLNTLILCLNEFREVPISILELSSLETLDMSVNQVAELPQDWLNLKNCLLNLKLSCNQLTEINCVVQLQKLQKLYCNFNRIEALPDEIVQIPLSEIRLISNQLKSLPEIEDGCKWIDVLQKVDFSQNQLDEVPESWEQLTALNYLRLASNQLTTIPTKLKVSETAVVDLANNFLVDVPPGLIYRAGVVTLDNNQIATLPQPLSDQENTTYSLSITHNALTTVPSLEPLSLLKVLAIAGNPLRRLPERLVNIDSISVLNLLSTPLSWDPSLQKELNKLAYLAASKNPKQFGENARKTKEKRLKELELKSDLTSEERAERHELRNDFRPAALLIEEEAPIPAEIKKLREVGKTVFENSEETKSVGTFIIDSKITAGGNHYQEDGIVTVQASCPALSEETASSVIAGILEQMTHKLNDDLQNQNLRYRGDSVLGGMMAAMAVNFQGKYYCRNVGDAQVQVIAREFLEAALNGSFDPFKDVDVDPHTFTPMQDWPALSLEERREFQEKGGQLDFTHEKEIRGDKAPTYSTIGDRAWSYIDCRVSEMIEYDVVDYPLVFLSSDGVTDVLSKAEIVNIIGEMIQQGGNDRESRLANFEKSMTRANRAIRDCAFGKGYNAAANHDNTAALLMVDKQAFIPKEKGEDESRQIDAPMQLLFLFDGHDGDHHDNFVDYALYQIPRYFSQSLANQLREKICDFS